MLGGSEYGKAAYVETDVIVLAARASFPLVTVLV
jgi:hypothetical protein